MVQPKNFEISQTAEGSTLVLSVTGELDMNTAEVLSDRVRECMPDGFSTLRLDLRELAFMDSSGLRLLIALHDRSREEDWTLTLLSPRSDAAAMVLRATGADTALPFEEGPAT